MTTGVSIATLPDNFPCNVALMRDTVQLAAWGLQRYRPFLEQMRCLESRFHLDRSAVTSEMEKIDNVNRWCGERLSELQQGIPIFFSVDYGTLRWLKGGMQLEIGAMKRARIEEFSKHTMLPVSVVESINTRISQYENMAESGIFNSMKPVSLAIESTMPAPIEVHVADDVTTTPKGPVVVMHVELLDSDLRHRCGDLYERFASDPTQQDRFDTVLRDATVVIESRIRHQSELPDSLVGEKLLAKALAADTGELVLSIDKSEREAVHLLFLGFFGLVRNTVNHRLVPTYTTERAAQVLGLADYLLFLLSRAQRRNPDGPYQPAVT